MGTTKDRLCFFCGGSEYNRKLWVMKNYNVQESESIWEPILLLPPCDDSPRQAMMDYNPRKSFSGHIHIWMLEEDSSAPVFVQSVESPYGEDHHIWLSTILEGNYKYNEHLFVESLVSPHGMGNDNGNCNEGRVTMAIRGDSSEKEGTETNSNKTSKGEKCRRQRRVYKR
ncbi:hypothetical protein Tco_0838701 [Tanacetum coccineum]|uniref:F-box associated domain-containing protein n=1 Tax=Tanacetum coccineum TaxID=301880 RepID=A0ABQ5ATI5_9ASTR